MGRKQRDLDLSGGPVAEFAAQLRAAREAAGNPTFASMSRRAHRSISALSEAAGGVEFPTWATVEAFVHACGQDDTAVWRERWEATQAALAQATTATQPNAPASVIPSATPASPAKPEAPAPPAAEPPVPRPRIPVRLRTLTALLAGLAIGLPVGAVLNSHPARGSTPAATLPHPLASVVIAPPPSPPPWPAQGSGCQARTHWVYQYPQSYAGQVYAQLADPTGQTVKVATTLTWGQWAWQRSVTVHPGDPAQAAGGTVLLFTKLDTSPRNPFVVIDTATPTCVAFGTASGTSVAPLATVDANLGWESTSPAPTG